METLDALTGRFQLVLLATSIVLVGASWLLQGTIGSRDVAESLLFTFIVGNSTRLAARNTTRLYEARSFPWDVLLLLLVQIPVCIGGGYFALILARLVALEPRGVSLWSLPLSLMLKSIFFSAVITAPVYLSLKRQALLESRNRRWKRTWAPRTSRASCRDWDRSWRSRRAFQSSGRSRERAGVAIRGVSWVSCA